MTPKKSTKGAKKAGKQAKAKKSPAKRKQAAATPIDAIRHKDGRVNIPTRELRDFVKAEEQAPKELLWPRDPSLDPQLVWKGKDEQDRQPLSVPAVPIYIQEKIHPPALIENLRDTAKPGEPEPELGLFDDFNGLEADFDKRVDFYHHEGHWTNRMILGDSLLVMASLAEKEGLKGKVQSIYLDPPYGIDFRSNWQVSTRVREVKDGKPDHASREPEVVRAFRDTWVLGIHSYLAYMRDRLIVARDLLTETGSVFVQIGDANVHLVRSLLDEVFGADNFCSLITFRKKGMPLGSALLEGTVDYLLWYARSKEAVKYRAIYAPQVIEDDTHWDRVELPDGSRRKLSRDEVRDHALIPNGGVVYQLHQLYPAGMNASGLFPFELDGRIYNPPPGRSWKTNLAGMRKLALARRLEPYDDGKTLRYVLKITDYPVTPLNNLWADLGSATNTVYAVQTNTKVVERCLLMTTDPGDLVLDPTCGSGTTAYVAEQWGRRWITCDTSRVALALARTRLMTARFPFYLLADSPEGVQKESEVTGQVPPLYRTDGDVRKGFIYRRVPHVTLKYIANNPDIRESMTRADIDAAIARHADTELLYDQPYKDDKRIRVTGPFTVESLSPHRVLSPDEERPRSEAEGQRDGAGGRFELMILENLRKAGVQNTRRKERLTFTRLDPWAGQWLQGAGEYQEADGKLRRVAIAIGPEHGTVGTQLVKEAAKEAVKGHGFDLLIVCGFAFDPHVSEEAKRFGDLTVLPARMNPDLAMGDELLKKTGVGNLFMVFGEPDVDVRRRKDGKLEVAIRGLDVYDPTTGQIRSGGAGGSGLDDIAAWFLDTNYDGESFFVRHAYFTGAGDPYEKLKRALKAEIDEAAWASLYSTVSRPFALPETGKIAIKVINHYGDEVLKVIDVE